ncbi:MAG TPA: hypothetical protein PLN25_10505 [Deltaproteobacteria bacterium]|nr:hypothetical protein [Deltaproteobacteria bacterium]HQB39680.1 hypothetical protein [Deltaproteobacteria bacterium]
MKRKLVMALACMMLTAFSVASVSAAETTKQKWVKKKKQQADREAERISDDHKGTVGSAKEKKQKADEYKKKKYKEIDDTAKQLGEGKKKR